MCTNLEDPKYIKSIVGQNISVTTINDEVHVGVLYVVDPTSKAAVIVNVVSSKYIVEIIPYNSIKSFEVGTSSTNNPKLLFITELQPEKSDTFLGKKLKLRDWFSQNQINVVEEEDILKLIDYNATVESPYGPEQCYCDNKIVLERVRTLIVNIPL